MMIFLGGSLAQAAQDTLVTLNVQSIRDIRGGHSRDQSIDVLNTEALSEKSDDWDQYVEFSPGRRKGYLGDFTFQLPSHILAEEVEKITLNINYQGQEKAIQRWSFKIRDFEKRRHVFLGDNQTAQDWTWTSMTYGISGNSYIASDGKIKIRLKSNNSEDVCNIDFLQIKLRTATDDDPPDDDPTDDDPTDDDPTDDDPTDDDTPSNNDFYDISLKSSITHVQPMTGIVFWTDSGRNDTDGIQLEYAYTPFNRIVENKDQYHWDDLDRLLSNVAARGHQAVLRFYYVYPGERTTVPDYVKSSTGYNETIGQSEGQTTYFPDWSSKELKNFTLDFYSEFAARFNNDARLAFLQVGFGLWGEYHIYDGPLVLGKTFPSKAFQARFVQHLDNLFTILPWSISIDAADTEVGPFGEDSELNTAAFGLFDDSFLHKTHDQYNAACFNFFNYEQRYRNSPMGGELSYYSDYDQQHALDIKGPYGIPFEELASQYHISYMIGNDQPDYQSMERIAAAGMATGYQFQIIGFKASDTQSLVTVRNIGVAPLYYDAFVTIDGVRSQESLKGLLPGQSKEFTITAGGRTPELTIECDRLVPGQKIEFEADL
jgi:hypothetical protein